MQHRQSTDVLTGEKACIKIMLKGSLWRDSFEWVDCDWKIIFTFT
jgi:hypothetical protein